MSVVEFENIPMLAESIAQSVYQRQPFSVTSFVCQDAIPSHLRSPQVFFDAVGVKVLPTTDKPQYCRFPRHEILMPPVEWLGLDIWQSCLAHELLHFSSVSCNWYEPPWKDELRAEIGESLLGSLLGIPSCSDHTNIKQWFEKWQAEIDLDSSLVMTATLSAIEGVENLIKWACFVQTREQKETEETFLALMEKAKQDVSE